ncbi:hypothetical protein [Streptomyces sp. NPDC002994]|uniref:hypothetical protein n=1 Tax=Streptomyces sp. NPDC002994 TaxID=3154441 RepID=UPI0033B806CE
MSHTIRIGRWTAELYQRAIYLQKQPDPHCRDCQGNGEVAYGPGLGPFGEEPDIQPCPCWDPYRSLRIPLWRKPAPDGWPF